MQMLKTKNNFLPFLFGLIFGASIAFSFNYYKDLRYYYEWSNERQSTLNLSTKRANVIGKNINKLENSTVEPESSKMTLITTTNNFSYLQPEQRIDLTDTKVDNSTAIDLYKNVRILCWVMTSPATLDKKAVAARDTWSKRCNIRLFMSSVENNDFPAVGLPVKEGRDQLYEKTKAAFKYVWEHYRDQADWFMKADDDTYVIVENLSYLLKDYDTKSPMYFGRRFKPFVEQGFMSGGAGYVLSKEALERFVEGIDSKKCPKGGAAEDVEIGKCLSELGVEAMDSRDDSRRETFHPYPPSTHLKNGSIPEGSWLWKYIYYPSCLGPTCITNYPISFHYVSPQDMYIFDYMIYNVRTYGVSYLYPKYDESESKRTD